VTELTVLVPTYRRPEVLRRTLEGYRNLNDPGVGWKLVLIDNAGDPETRQVAEAFSADVPLEFAVETRRGKSVALNTGLEHAEGEVLVLADDDTIPDPDWLTQLWTGAQRWPDATIFAGKILAAWPPGHEAMETPTDILRSAYGITFWEEEEKEISPMKVWGGNMAVRSAPFDEGVRFDPTIGPSAGQYAMGEELEFVLRMSRAGHKAVYLPRALVHHQIRPEQMTESWLKWRAYRSGRGVARLVGLPDGPSMRGVPLFIFREIATHGLNWLQGWAKKDHRKRLDRKLDFYHWVGKLRGYWDLGRKRGDGSSE
jgi:glycosyltransferase involved in cell wall biosynthesis